jgi:hypothetical protein
MSSGRDFRALTPGKSLPARNGRAVWPLRWPAMYEDARASRMPGPWCRPRRWVVIVTALLRLRIARRHSTIPSGNRQTARPYGGALKP